MSRWSGMCPVFQSMSFCQKRKIFKCECYQTTAAEKASNKRLVVRAGNDGSICKSQFKL